MTPEYKSISLSQLDFMSAHFSTQISTSTGGPTQQDIKDGTLRASTPFNEGTLNDKNLSSKDGLRIYVVQSGDNLSKIAEDFSISINTIKWENNIGNTIKPGQELKILPETGIRHSVKKGDTLSKIANLYEVELDELESKSAKLKVGEKIFIKDGKKRGSSSKAKVGTSSSTKYASRQNAQSGYYIRPLQGGRLTSKYGPRGGRYHYGLDFGAARGTALVSSASGTVIKTVSSCREGSSSCGGGYGNYVVIKHGNGTKTLYAHMQKVSVSYGQKLAQGEKIGTIGNTGRSTGPHTHFEIENIRTGKKIKPPFTW